MADFRIKIKAIKSTVDAEERIRRELVNIQQSIREISGGLVIQSVSVSGIKRSLDSLAGRVEGHRNSIKSMKDALERAVELYEKTEKNICGYTDGVIKNSKSQESKVGATLSPGYVNLFGGIVDGLFSPIKTVWDKYLWPGIEGIIQGIIGKGEVSENQPTASWAEKYSNLMAAVKRALEKITAEEEAAAVSFVPRTTAPDSGNSDEYKYYFSRENPYPSAGNVPINNCTKYAFGRAYELLGYRPEPTPPGQGNANLWFSNFNPAYERSTDISKPRVGAIICWSGGEYGHVAVVEAVNGDQITYSDSSWSYKYKGEEYPGWTYQTHTVSINELSKQMGATFQGYIYLPGVGES